VIQFREGQNTGEAKCTLDESGRSFRGSFKTATGTTGEWNGWRPDPDSPRGAPAKLAGLWLTDLGLMELEQTGDRAKGHYAVRGVSDIEGKLTGRRVDFTFKSFGTGTGWFDVSPAGATLAGAAVADGFTGWWGWRGRRAPEFVRHAPLAAGKIVDGSTNNLLSYSARAPNGYDPKSAKKLPAIVILHGSNMSGKMYVATIAAAWPDVARDYLLIGINGERPSDIGAEPAFNYTYVDYVGRSTFKGYPGTDRESPALVAEAMAELRETYPVARYFVGGHSQGGFLTYSLLMNFPQQIAGAFPVSGGVMFQCEPKAFDDDKLRAAQRAVPLAVVHGKGDPLVDFKQGEYAAKIFQDAGWQNLRFFADDTGAGHRFAMLPVGEAVRWLEGRADAAHDAK
jgi:predicted esterase